MTRPGWLAGIAAAAALAAGSGLYAAAIPEFLAPSVAARALVTVLCGAYLIWLLRYQPNAIGKVSAAVAWCGFASLAWVLAPSVGMLAAGHALVIWLLRSLFFHDSLLPAGLDLLLGLAALLFAGVALERSGSVALSVWCFFLTQAAFAALPRRSEARLDRMTDAMGFERARRQADAAIDRLSSR